MTGFGPFGAPDTDVVKALKWIQENSEKWSRKIYGNKKNIENNLKKSVKEGVLLDITNGIIQTGAIYEYCKLDTDRRILLYLISITIKGKLNYDPNNLYEDYFLKGKLAASAKYETIMKYTHIKQRKTLRKSLKRLEDSSMLKRIHTKTYKGRGTNVYILGSVEKKGDRYIKRLKILDKMYADGYAIPK